MSLLAGSYSSWVQFANSSEKSHPGPPVPRHWEFFTLESFCPKWTLAARMTLKRKIAGGIVAVVGFMLSPLSWWNDAFVNLPLALVFAWLVSLPCPAGIRETVFDVAVVIGYLLTNVLGFVLLHKGAQAVVSNERKPYSWRDLIKDVGISLGYTALIVLLIKLGVLKPFQAYFSKT